jgi:uncharacterized protein
MFPDLRTLLTEATAGAIALYPRGMTQFFDKKPMKTVSTGSTAYDRHRRLQGRWLGVLAAIAAIALWFRTPPALAISVYNMPFIAAGEDTWIVDEGNSISRINEIQIAKALTQLREQTGAEVRFVTVRHVDYGETIQSFTDKVFEKWFPTADEQANQVLIALDVVTNNAGIRVGDGLTEQLTPEIAKSVAQETVLYPLIEGDKYNEAFIDAKDRLVAVLSGEPDPGAPELKVKEVQVEGTFATAEETAEKRSDATTFVIVLLIAATVIPMVTYYALYS